MIIQNMKILNCPFDSCSSIQQARSWATPSIYGLKQTFKCAQMLISVGIANQQGKHRFGWHIVTTRIRSYSPLEAKKTRKMWNASKDLTVLQFHDQK